MVIIDTSVWVPAYKVRTSPEKVEVARLVSRDEAAIVGIIFTEVMRGARNEAEFEEMREELLAATYIEDDFEDWLTASRLLFELKLQGQIIPLPDALIAAQALRTGHAVYTHDEHFKRVAGLKLHTP